MYWDKHRGFDKTDTVKPCAYLSENYHNDRVKAKVQGLVEDCVDVTVRVGDFVFMTYNDFGCVNHKPKIEKLKNKNLTDLPF